MDAASFERPSRSSVHCKTGLPASVSARLRGVPRPPCHGSTGTTNAARTSTALADSPSARSSAPSDFAATVASSSSGIARAASSLASSRSIVVSRSPTYSSDASSIQRTFAMSRLNCNCCRSISVIPRDCSMRRSAFARFRTPSWLNSSRRRSVARRSPTFDRSVSTVFQSRSSRSLIADSPVNCESADPVRCAAARITRTSSATFRNSFAASLSRFASSVRVGSGSSGTRFCANSARASESVRISVPALRTPPSVASIVRKPRRSSCRKKYSKRWRYVSICASVYIDFPCTSVRFTR